MSRRLKISLLAGAVCLLAVPALAFTQWVDGLGNLFTGSVSMWITGGGQAVVVSAATPMPAADANNASFTRWPAVASGAAFPAGTRAWRYNCSGPSIAIEANSFGDSATWTLASTSGFWVVVVDIPASVTLSAPTNCLLESLQ